MPFFSHLETQGAYDFHIVNAVSVSYLTVCDLIDSVEAFHHSLIVRHHNDGRILLSAEAAK